MSRPLSADAGPCLAKTESAALSGYITFGTAFSFIGPLLLPFDWHDTIAPSSASTNGYPLQHPLQLVGILKPLQSDYWTLICPTKCARFPPRFDNCASRDKRSLRPHRLCKSFGIHSQHVITPLWRQKHVHHHLTFVAPDATTRHLIVRALSAHCLTYSRAHCTTACAEGSPLAPHQLKTSVGSSRGRMPMSTPSTYQTPLIHHHPLTTVTPAALVSHTSEHYTSYCPFFEWPLYFAPRCLVLYFDCRRDPSLRIFAHAA